MKTIRLKKVRQTDKLLLKEARYALKKIFMEDLLCEGEETPAFRRALDLLHSYPQLAREWFDATEESVSFRFLPLSIFVASGAGIDAIEFVHNLNTKAVSTRHPDLRLYPFHAACEVHADEEVIEFLYDEFPDAIQTRDYKGDLAIHSVLSQGNDQMPKRRTIECLLDLYPESVKERNAAGLCPLGVAFQNECGPKVMDRIIEKRNALGLSDFSIANWEDYVLTAKDVSRLSMELFPKLKLTSFHCEPSDYTRDGFIYLMESLAADETVQKLALAFPPLGGGRSEAFLGLLSRNKFVRELTLIRNVSMWSKGSGVDTLLQGLGVNETLEKLKISGVFLLSSFEVGHLIGRAPKTLVLNSIMMESRWRSTNSSTWKGSKLENLTIRNCKVRGSSLDKMLESLTNLPNLTSLTLDFSNPEDKHDEKHLKNRDVTKPIKSLLKKGKLEKLVLQGLNIDMQKLSGKLYKNKTLRVLHLDAVRNSLSMEVGWLVGAFIKGNQTLEEVKFHCDYNYDEKKPDEDGNLTPTFKYVEDPAIKYYTNLNISGRQASQLENQVYKLESMPVKETSLLHDVITKSSK